MRIFKAALIMVSILFVGATIIFMFNIQRSSDKPTSRKASGALLQMIASENADDQNMYFKISDSLAFMVGKNYLTGEDTSVTAVVKYKPEVAPFCWLCGSNQINGGVLRFPYIKDNYVYEQEIDYSTSMDTTFKVLNLEDYTVSSLSLEEGTQLGLSTSDQYKATVSQVTDNYGFLSFSKEGCIVVMSAFIFIYFVFIVWFVILKMIRKKKAA